MSGCPACTTQVVFFTDDATFIDDDEDDLPGDLCLVARGIPVRSMVWVQREHAWEVDGDFRVFAVGVTGDRTTFSIASTLCEAVEARYGSMPGGPPAGVRTALSALRREDGAEFDPVAISLGDTQGLPRTSRGRKDGPPAPGAGAEGRRAKSLPKTRDAAPPARLGSRDQDG